MESSVVVSILEHVSRCAASGLSCAEYARRENISVKNLYNARERARDRLKPKVSKKGSAASVMQPALFKAVRVSEPLGLELSMRCVLQLVGGHRLEMSRLPDPQWLMALSGAIPVVR